MIIGLQKVILTPQAPIALFIDTPSTQCVNMVLEEVYAQSPNSNSQLVNIADGRSILTLVVFFLSSKFRQAMRRLRNFALEFC